MTIAISAPRNQPDLIAAWRAQYPKFRALIDAGGAPLTALRYLGLALWGDRRFDEAAAVMHASLTLAPNDPIVLGELGRLLCDAGKPAPAMLFLEAALKLDRDQTQVWLALAHACKEAGDPNAAEDGFWAALEVEPKSMEAAVGLGLLYIEQRRLNDAARLFRAAVEGDGAAPAVYACLGQTLYLLGEFSDASAALENAARGCPNEAGIVRKYAVARLTQAMIESPVAEAIEIYHLSAGRHAEGIDTVCRSALQALGAYGRREAAIRLGAFLLERAPDDPVIRYRLDALRGLAHARAPMDYLTASFDKYAPEFDRHLVGVLDYRLPEKLRPLLVETGLRFDNILDLGCGTGLAAPLLSSFGAKLTGVDLSPRMLDKARERNLYGRLIEDEAIAYLSKQDERYDLIVALDVIVYFGDLAAMFAAVAGSLAPRGVFAFSFETGCNADYAFLPSGRFAHDPAYVERLCEGRFACIAGISTTLRLEANRPVEGRLVLLRSP